MPIDSNFYGTMRKEAHGDSIPIGNFFLPTQVAAVQVTNQGVTPYTSVPTVVFTGGGGSGAAGTAILNFAGQLVGVLLTNPGSGFTSAPVMSFTGGGGSGAAATAVLGSSANITATGLLGTFNAAIYSELELLVDAVLVTGTTPSFTFKLQTSDDNGNTWYDLPSGGLTAITAAGRFILPYSQSNPIGVMVGVFVTVTGTTPVFAGNVTVEAK